MAENPTPPNSESAESESADAPVSAAAELRNKAGKKAAIAAKAGFEAMQKVGKGAALRFRGMGLAILSAPLLIFRGDLATRILTLGLFASIGLLVVTTVRLWERFVPASIKQGGTSETSEGVAKFLKEQREMAIATASVVFLERFSATLRSDATKAQVFEVEVYVETDGPETSALLKSKLDEVHEMVSAAMQGQVYERLITDEGKVAFKKQIGEAITRGIRAKWNFKGEIKRVFFTRFVMG